MGPPEASSGAGGSGAESGQGGSSATSGSGAGPGAGGGEVEVPMGYADGVTVTDLDLYQAVRVPLMEDGQPATSDIPIVAGRAGTLRVFYQTDAAYDGQPVRARLTIGGGEPAEIEQTLSGTSTHLELASTLNIPVPGDIMTTGGSYKVELLQPLESVTGTNAQAAWPRSGEAPMNIVQGAAKLKVMLVPVQYGGSLPDTSPAQLERYQRYFSEQYPVPEVEISVRSSAYPYNGSLGSGGGWSDLLDQITDLRNADNAPDDVYYYGIHMSQGGGLLGLGWIGGSSDVWSRTAIGVGWTGDTAPETAVHEVGHNHGRDHSPCGVSGDPSFPHPGASIGVWGYRPSDQALLDPDEHADFMSYCHPAWISDWTYKAIFQRAKVVSSQPYILVPQHLVNRTYDRIKVLDGQAYLKDTVVLPRPPEGEPTTVTLSDGQTTGHYFPYNHIDGGVLLVMRPTAGPMTFSAEGHTFTLSR